MKWTVVGNNQHNITLNVGDLIFHSRWNGGNYHYVNEVDDFNSDLSNCLKVNNWAGDSLFNIISEFTLPSLFVFRYTQDDVVGVLGVRGKLPLNSFHSEPLPLP